MPRIIDVTPPRRKDDRRAGVARDEFRYNRQVPVSHGTVRTVSVFAADEFVKGIVKNECCAQYRGIAVV
jgi:hypothetical protein